MIRFYAWWSGMSRQGRTGWTLVTVAVVYLLYFLKARLFSAGTPVTSREWFTVVGMAVLLMLGTINIRMAEMRARREGVLPLVDPRILRK